MECNAFMWMNRCNMDVGNVLWGFLLMCEIGCELPEGFAEVIENIAAFHHTFCEMMTRTHSLACSFQGYTHTSCWILSREGLLWWSEMNSTAGVGEMVNIGHKDFRKTIKYLKYKSVYLFLSLSFSLFILYNLLIELFLLWIAIIFYYFFFPFSFN